MPSFPYYKCIEVQFLTKTIKSLILGLLVVRLSISLALAAGPSVHFEHLSIENGLPQNSAKAILQDKQGFLWIGTEEGLARYDGYEFKIFKSNFNNAHSLSGNYVTVLFEDLQSNLWIGTRGGGLNRFNPTTEQFTHFRHNETNPNTLSNNTVHAITQDSKSNIWIGTDGGGLNRLDPVTKQFTHYRHKKVDTNSLSHDAVSVITEDLKGNIWLGTWGGGLNHFNPVTNKFTHYKQQPKDANSISDNAVSAIIKDKQGNLWIGTKGGGLNYFDTDSKQFTHYRHKENNLNSLSHDEIGTITIDNQGTLWLGTLGGGLNHFDPITKKFTHYLHQTSNINSLSNNSIRALTYDHQGNLWVGTDGGGINRLNSLTKQFTHYHHQSKNPNSLSNNIVRAITQDRQGTLWVGTWGGGLNRFNSATGQFTHYKNDKTNSNSLSDNKIYVITEDNQNNLWIGTDGNALNRFNPATEQFTHYQHEANNPKSLSDNAVSAITQDQQGNIWIGTWKGLNLFNPITEQFTHYRHQPANSNSLSNDSIRVITEDRQGKLWIGTWKGLNHFDPDTGKFTHYTHKAKKPNSLSNNTVYAITEDSQGNLWVGTASGLNLFNKLTGNFTHFFEKDGLPNNVVYRIEEDDKGEIWLSTNLGLSNFNLKTKKFKNYNMDDGLQSNEFNADASFKSKYGELFFGGINGFNRFFPNKVISDNQQPKVIFTDMLLSNQSVPIRNTSILPSQKSTFDEQTRSNNYTLAKAIHSTSEVTLTHQQNLVAFEFSALHFSNPKKNQYAYKMEGFNDEWIATDYKNRRATYTNLPTGNYVLRIKASNPYGIWNEQGAALKITVLPPPWLSWWAYSLYCLLLIFIMWLFVHAQRKKIIFIKKINEQLEIKVAKRTLGLQKANEKLASISNTDELTGLNNRRFIAHNLKSDIDLVLQRHRSLNLSSTIEEQDESDLIFFLLDLDYFKHVNDIYGHTAGDAVLMQIKPILKRVFKNTDYLVRWGGEEFLVVARFTNRSNAPVLAEKLRESVEKHNFVIGEGRILSKTCSIGYASFPFSLNNPEALKWEQVLDIADHCLYAAKKSTRNTWIGLSDINCEYENLFKSVTEKTEELIQLKQLKVECFSHKPNEINWE